ncbi:MAG: PEP-CTERM sorting domain-containing protein, partial [Proteobacteria bacterium]
AFVTALAGGTGNRDWGSASQDGLVPAGARELIVTLAETKTAEGAYIDGYVDNVRLDMNVVPEPSSALLGLAGGLILLRRRK